MKKAFFCGTKVGDGMQVSGGKIIFNDDFLEIKGSFLQTLLNGFKPVYFKVMYSNIKCITVTRSLIVIGPNVEIECFDSQNINVIAIGSFGMKRFIKVLKSLELSLKLS